MNLGVFERRRDDAWAFYKIIWVLNFLGVLGLKVWRLTNVDECYVEEDEDVKDRRWRKGNKKNISVGTPYGKIDLHNTMIFLKKNQMV